MLSRKQKIVIGISGASGAIYAQVLLRKLQQLHAQYDTVAIVMSKNARTVWQHEIGDSKVEDYGFPIYDIMDFNAPFASGSGKYNTMIIAPCSMGTVAKIAHGISNDLMTRAADVMLKERHQLICVVRESPLHLIHLNNMKIITEAGGIICPASPSFYSKPQTIEDAVATIIDRTLHLCGFQLNSYTWPDAT